MESGKVDTEMTPEQLMDIWHQRYSEPLFKPFTVLQDLPPQYLVRCKPFLSLIFGMNLFKVGCAPPVIFCIQACIAAISKAVCTKLCGIVNNAIIINNRYRVIGKYIITGNRDTGCIVLNNTIAYLGIGARHKG